MYAVLSMIAPLCSSIVARRQQAWLYPAAIFLLFSFFISACNVSIGNTSPTPTAAPPTQAQLTKLHWCGKPLMVFRDEGAPATPAATSTPTTGTTPATSPTAGTTPATTATPGASGTPTTLTNWAQVEPLLGFTVYLPANLPPNTCLVSAIGTVNDPIFGGSFTIGYLLPNRSSISISEAPLRAQTPDFQCTTSSNPTPQTTPTAGAPTVAPASQVCSGAKGQTNIVFSAPGDVNTLHTFFNALQPNVKWVPVA
ncbi:MAG: hypothetical protein H0W02_08750 [Ktedonobacteraceae bacterium]|nr:hypothetical protein [Ktedonobacteraceae bacterium]